MTETPPTTDTQPTNSEPDEHAVRRWLVDYLVSRIGCSAEHIDRDATMHDLGVGSRDAVVLTGELSDFLGRAVSPLEFWQYPTVSALSRFLTGGEVEPVDLPSAFPGGREPIAVIGVGCRVPGGIHGPDALWQVMVDDRCVVGEVPDERWEWFDDGGPDAGVLASTTRFGGFLEDVAGFDAAFFDISPGEADKMDPQQRLLLEVTQEALEHAGIPADSLAETRTGVFAGACSPDYWTLASGELTGVDGWSGTGGALSIIANRVSYFFDFRGPSVTVDTACSSSLVAVHLACQSLRTGESDVALAAGVNVLLSPASTRSFDVAEALSDSGRCHAFDAAADGFVRSEGAGVVVLKRLSDARRDGDRVLAVVRGSAVNQDGRSNGLMAPNPAAQMAVLRSAYSDAGVDVRDVDYVEAHGTGTLLGDPIEARALGTVIGKGRPADGPLLIGSVKTNLGHLESAAGLAGLAKAVMALDRGTIPATVGYQSPNPHIPFEKLRLKVVDSQIQWPDRSRPRRAGVSSFGFGGTNAHVVLEQAPAQVPPQPAEHESPVTTVVISGKTPERIAATAATLAEWMDGAGAGVALADVAHTLNHHRDGSGLFATVCARDRAGAVAGLSALAEGRSAPGVVGAHRGRCASGTVFVFSGQGSQWAGMARQLLTEEPEFAAAVDELEPLFVDEVGYSLREVIAEGRPLTGDAMVQPVIMGVQLALTALWRSHGVHPDAVIGHSMGEVTAAVVSGALTPAQGLRVIATRSRLMAERGGRGGVGLVDLDGEAAALLVGGYPGVEVAGYLSPRQTVIAGPADQVQALLAEQTAANRFARRVNMELASHTALMDPVLPALREALADVKAKTPSIPFISTVTDPTRSAVLDADYWADNVRRPVNFHRAVATAATDYGTFIEVSPNPILTHAIDATLGESHHHAIPTLVRDTDDTLSFHTNLNATHTTRPPVTPHPGGPHVTLPNTPWQHTRHWFTTRPRRRSTAALGESPRERPAGAIPVEWVSELRWPACPLAEPPTPATGAWLVIGNAALGAEIGRTAGAVTVLPPGDATADAIAAALSGVTHVLYEPATDNAHTAFREGRDLAMALAACPAPPTLFLLTRNAQPVEPGDRANPVHAVLWGLGRSLALEHPEIWGALIDVDELVPAEVAASYVLAEAAGDQVEQQGEDQIVYRAGVRRIPRLEPAALPSAAPPLHSDTSHLVVGATGNIGPSLIRQLADMGARTVVAVSRNPGSRLDALTAELAQRGVTLLPVAADASDEASLSELFSRFGSDLPPLEGIYLAAFAGGPVTLLDMTVDDITTMFRPKIDAAHALHRLSLKHPVRNFVLFSSISGVLGSRWLAHYAATTTFLDALAFARRAAGLPATAVNWGLWKSLADSQTGFERQVTAESGLLPMADDVAITALASVIGAQAPVRSTVVAADWDRLAAAYRTRTPLHIIDDVLVEHGSDGVGSATEFRKALRGCDPPQRRDMLTDHVAAMVAQSMGLRSSDELDRRAGFFQSGMNSLMSVDLRRLLSESLGVELPASVVFDYPTVDALTEYLAALLPETDTATAPGGLDEEDLDGGLDDYDDLAEDELLQKLSERLG